MACRTDGDAGAGAVEVVAFGEPGSAAGAGKLANLSSWERARAGADLAVRGGERTGIRVGSDAASTGGGAAAAALDFAFVVLALAGGAGAGAGSASAGGSGSSSIVAAVLRVVRFFGKGLVLRAFFGASSTSTSCGSSTATGSGAGVGSPVVVSSSSFAFAFLPRVVLRVTVAAGFDTTKGAVAAVVEDAAVEAFGGRPRRLGATGSGSGSAWASIAGSGSGSGSASRVTVVVARPRFAVVVFLRVFCLVSAMNVPRTYLLDRGGEEWACWLLLLVHGTVRCCQKMLLVD